MENILSVNLSTTTAPVVQEVRGKDWISYGTEDWANLFTITAQHKRLS